jgi:hypothetical protein
VTSTGTITIQFITGSADDPKVSAIQIVAAAAPAPEPLLSLTDETDASILPVAIADAAERILYYEA